MSPVNRDEFEAVVLSMVNDGDRVTATEVSDRIGLSVRTCTTLLDALVHDGSLDRDEDDDNATYGKPRIVRRGAGPRLDDAERSLRNGTIDAAGRLLADGATARVEVVLEQDALLRRKYGVAALVGLLLGPLGLVYVAPWKTAGLWTLVYLGVRWLPFLPSDGMWKLWLAVHALCALVNLAYTFRFNREGGRSPLLPSRR
jgi:hypothetical protein